MSENVELVKESFRAFCAWDLDALLHLYHPDIEFLPLTGTRVETGGYRGHDGFRAYWEEARNHWDVLEPEGVEFSDLGDRVLVAGHCHVRGRASGAESDPTCAWVIGIRDGTIVSHVVCETYEEALEVAGATPSTPRASDPAGRPLSSRTAR